MEISWSVTQKDIPPKSLRERIRIQRQLRIVLGLWEIIKTKIYIVEYQKQKK